MVTQASAPTIAITGLAWMTALGEDLDGVWNSMLSAETGFRDIPCEYDVRSRLAATVASIDLEKNPGERLRYMAYNTARRAMLDARIEAGEPRLQLIMGTSFGDYLEREDQADVSLYSWAQDVAQKLEVVRAPIAVSTACSSGSDAILLGAELIRTGVADVCVCGGVDILTLSKRLAHSVMMERCWVKELRFWCWSLATEPTSVECLSMRS
jgi:3-oxoacyl-[acyl-carrier-protein] synthase II